MEQELLQELKQKLANLEGRWPAHSVPPSLWQEREALEQEIDRLERALGKPD